MNNQANFKVRLDLFADTKNVTASLNALNQQFNNTLKNMDLSKGILPGVEKAKQSILSLQTALHQAVNVDTGHINFDKLNASLAASGHNIQSIGKNMAKMGTDGVKMFGDFAKTAAQASIPLRQSSTLMTSLMNTLGNTIKWQLASKAINMVTGSIRSAINYAKDLDKILTDISIVSDMSKGQLESFAKEANKAARQLGASTKEYMEASVIFFQQGLDPTEVKKRTDVVMQMTKVTGESANQVSSYMTAIWNNFDNGSKSLEHYADIITALGAATASSSEEIAGGLEKFASIAETVGLSYEYATAALATVVAETRQSEDTVGTSFKTIFGRLQSLSLGESLEDDTTLTKYSNALLAVGVNIKESNGELKTMDVILDELGQKWNSLNKDQQVALAYTVAGTRQYNNFIALMDSYATSFQKNLDIAKNAAGTLDKQTEDYRAGWEATRKQVQASMEGLYDSFFNEEFFKDVNKVVAPIIDAFSFLVKGLGGFNTIVPMLTTFFLTLGQDKIVNGMKDIAYNFGIMTGAVQQRAIAFKESAINTYTKQAYALQGKDPDHITEASSMQMHADAMQRRSQLQIEMFRLNGKIGEEQRIQLETEIALNAELDEKIISYGKLADEAQRLTNAAVAEQKTFATANSALTLSKPTWKVTKAGSSVIGGLGNLSELEARFNQAGITRNVDDQVRLERLKEINKELQTGVDNMTTYNARVEEAQRLEAELGRSVSARINQLANNYRANLQVQGLTGTENGIVAGNNVSVDSRAEYAAQASSTIASLQEKQRLYLQSQGFGADDVQADETSRRLQELINKLTTVSNEFNNTDASAEDLKITIDAFNDTLRQAAPSTETATNEFVEQTAILTNNKNAAEETARKIQGLAENNVLLATTAKASKDHMQGMGDLMRKTAAESGGLAQSIVTTASALMSLLGAINSLKNVGRIINDDSLTGFEKFTQVAMSSLMAFTSVMGVLRATGLLTKKVENEHTQDTIKDSAALDTHTKAVNRDTNSLSRGSGQKDGSSGNLPTDTPETGDMPTETPTDTTPDTVNNKNQKVKGKGKKTKTPKGKGAGKGAKVAGKGAGASAASMGYILAGVAVAVAATAAIVAIYNKAENAAKKQEKAAKAAEEQYKKVRTEYETLQSTIDDYSKEKDALDTMIKGTDEWKESLQSANEKAKALINSMKHAKGIKLEYSVDENGLIQISEESLKEAEQYKKQQATTMELISMGAQQRAETARYEADLVKYQRKKLKSGGDIGQTAAYGAGGLLAGMASGALIGAGIGAAGAGVGAIPGMIIGGIVGLAGAAIGTSVGGQNSLSEKEAVSTLTKKLEKMSDKERAEYDSMSDDQYEQYLKSLNITDNRLIDSLTKNRDSLDELVDEQIKNREALIANTQALLADTYKDEFADAANKAAAAKLVSTYQTDEKYKQQVKDELGKWDRGWFGVDYQKEMESLSDGRLKVSNRGGKNIKLEILNEETGKYEAYSDSKITREEGWNILIDMLAGDKMSDNVKEAVQDMNDAVETEALSVFGKSSKDLDKHIVEFLGQAYTDFTLGNDIDISSLTRQDAYDLSQQNWTTEMGQAIKAATENYDTYIKNKNKQATADWLKNSQDRIENDRIEAQELLSLSDEAYEVYKNAILETNEALSEQEDLTTQLITRNFNLVNAFNSVHKSLKENLTDLTAIKNHLSTDYLKALGSIKKAFIDAFGFNVSEEFIETNLDDIVAATEGDMTAASRVLQGLVTQNISNDATLLAEEKESLANVFTGADGLFNSNFQVGDTLAGNQSAEVLRQMVADGVITSEQAQKWLQNSGFVSALDENGNIDLNKTYYQGLDKVFISNESLLDKEYNTLYQTNRELKKYRDNYEEMSKLKEKAYGKERIQAILNEKNALAQVNTELEKANDQLELDREKKKNEMDKWFKDRQIELIYDQDGNIAGYKDLKTNKTYDKDSDWYNTLMSSDQFKYGNDEPEKMINAYDSLGEAIEKNSKEISENTETMQEYDFETLEYTIKHADEQIQFSNEKLADELKDLGDKVESAYSRGAIYDQQADNAVSSFLTNYAGFLDAKAKYEADVNDTKAQENMKTFYNQMVKAKDELRTLRETYRNNFIEAIEKGTQAIEEQKDIINTLSDMLANYGEVVKILGKEVLQDQGNLMTTIQQNSLNNAKNMLLAEIEHKQAIDDNLTYAKTLYQEYRALGDEQASVQKQRIDELEAQSLDSSNTVLEAYIRVIEEAQTMFTVTVDNALAGMQSVLAAEYGSFEYMLHAQQQQKDLSDLYLDTYDQEYQLSTLMRDINKSIDNTRDIAGKTALYELQQRINALEEEGNTVMGQKTNLMQEQVDLMRAEYEIELARIALEDAQNAKTQVQLQQTATGNWTYVYTANKENIDAAQQTLEDKMYSLNKLKSDLNQQWMDEILSLEDAFGNEIKAILDMEFETTEDQINAIVDYVGNALSKLQTYTNGLTAIGDTRGLTLYNTISAEFNKVRDAVLTAYDTEMSTIGELSEFLIGDETLEQYLTNNINKTTERSEQALDGVLMQTENLKSQYTQLSNQLLVFESNYARIMDGLQLATKEACEDIGNAFDNLLDDLQLKDHGLYIEISGYEKFDGSTYDTGGYTGSWGSEGKLAVLHEKELVLNRDDTSNMLKMLQLVQEGDILSRLSQQQLASLELDYNAMLASVTSLAKPSQGMEQTVHISADFPNAVYHDEISAAFDNLINMASQYAARK